MKATIMRNALITVVLAGAWLGAAAPLRAQAPAGTNPAVPPSPGELRTPTVPATAPATSTVRPEDQQALQSVTQAYVRAYNAGDAHALASLFTDDAEMIDEHGDRLRGRATIETVFAAMFRERPGATISITPVSLRAIAPDVAEEEGQNHVKVGEEGPSTRHYTVVYVKQGDRWRYSKAREEHERGLGPHQRLQELEWLVGEWTDESPDSVVRVNCRWTEDGNFLLRDFRVQVQGKSVMTVSERIGWDPATRQIRSWVFDSEGGHGTGLWSRAGNEWVIKSTGVMPDGRTATATHTLTRVNPQSARWTSVERTVGDRIVPDHAEYLMVRQPPSPRGR
jgi:uncharacterized protein (TIGR02246 family)